MAERRFRRPDLRTALVGASIALVVGGVALRWSAPQPDKMAAAGDAASLRAVATRRVASQVVRSQTQIAAVLEARRSVQLFAETRGPVTAVGAEALDRVEAGQVLAQIDPLLAEVGVERAEASLARRRSERALARSNLARRRKLATQGVVSDAGLEDAENADKVAAAAVREATAELRSARDALSKKTIVAPFSGVLRTFPVEVGEYVREGLELAELLDLSTARITVGLADREVVAVRAGQPVQIVVEAYPGEDFEGEILRVGAASDSVTRKFPVEVELPNPDGRLLPGMIVRATLGLDASRAMTLVPRDATVDEFGLRFVYVIERVEEGGLVARRRRVEVRPIPFHPADFEVVSGLTPGDEIAITAIRQLSDGERIQRNGVHP